MMLVVPVPLPWAAGLAADTAALVPPRSVTTESRLQPVGLLRIESISACVVSVISSLTQNRPYTGWSYTQIRRLALISGLFPLMKKLPAAPRGLGTTGVETEYGGGSFQCAAFNP